MSPDTVDATASLLYFLCCIKILNKEENGPQSLNFTREAWDVKDLIYMKKSQPEFKVLLKTILSTGKTCLCDDCCVTRKEY